MFLQTPPHPAHQHNCLLRSAGIPLPKECTSTSKCLAVFGVIYKQAGRRFFFGGGVTAAQKRNL